MELVIVEAGGVATVAAKGRIDSVTAKEFGARVAELIRAGASRLVIDLDQVVYISSAGFRALLIAGKLVEETNGKLAVCGVTGEVRRLFEVAAVTSLFNIYPTREDSVAGVRAAG